MRQTLIFRMKGFKITALEISEKLPFSGNFSRYPINILFCPEGKVALSLSSKAPLPVSCREIYIFSGQSITLSCETMTKLFLVSIDPHRLSQNYVPPTLQRLCSMLGLHGYMLLAPCPWIMSFFDMLYALPGDMENFLAIKSLEICYLAGDNTIKSASDPNPAPSDCQIISICSYIQDNLGEKLSISKISRLFCMSQTKLKCDFKNSQGVSIHKWIKSRRMEHAAFLLASSDKSVLDISQAVGYNSISQFNCSFKQMYSMTPTLYRKLSKNI